MYKVKGFFVVKKDVFVSNEHFLKGLDYKAQASKDGFVRICQSFSEMVWQQDRLFCLCGWCLPRQGWYQGGQGRAPDILRKRKRTLSRWQYRCGLPWNVDSFLYFIGKCVLWNENAPRGSHCGGMVECRLRDPPQAENPASQDSFLFHRKMRPMK